ncbi:MAG TPA: hypothetical protein VHI51_03375, partial [Ktedonobacterales bacterium]|nr:hypothetical protein [Ktedonobacterales bacterium]
PPAWTDVWICASPRGRLQATRRDSRGRKQYRYHERWIRERSATKYERMIAFGEALTAIRVQVERDLTLAGLPREHVIATVVTLLDTTLARVGNEAYARENHSYGLTTLRQRHVEVDGASVILEFRGKAGKRQRVEAHGRKLASVVRRYLDLPRYELFQYIDQQRTRHTVQSDDVNEYLRATSGQDFTAKDFRTWGATTLALHWLCERGACESRAEAQYNVREAIEEVAHQLGNTPAICRKSYVNPRVIDAYLDGALIPDIARMTAEPPRPGMGRLRSEEVATLAFLQDLERKARCAS